MSLFGAGSRNNANRRAENAAFKQAKEQWRFTERERRDQYNYAKEQRDLQIEHNEDNLRYQETGMMQGYEAAVEMQDYEFETASRAYNKSVEQAETQKKFNQIAARTANKEQTFKTRDDMLSVMFEESQTLMDYSAATAGLKVNKQNQLVDANFEAGRITNKYISDVGTIDIERRRQRSKAQVDTQQIILQGMKNAGKIAARGASGRSANKAVIGTLAESGAMRSAIANGLMYAEQGMDLNLASLKDMLILEQTMVQAARDRANNEYDLKSSTLDADLKLNKLKLSATKQSIADRDRIVRKNITNALMQQNMNAEASVLLEPERMPEIANPYDVYAEYDDPETEDYVEILLRPLIADFPEYRETPEPDKKAFRGSLGRENVGLSNFGDVLKIGGMVAGGISAIGPALSLGSLGAAGGAGTFLGATAKSWGAIGTSLGGLGNSFYPTR